MIRKHITSTLREEGGTKPKTVKHEEVWTRVSDDPPTWKCLARDLDDDKFESTTRFKLTDDGLVYDQLSFEGTNISIDPPKVQLPRDPRVGARWSGDHAVGSKKQKRDCEIAAHAKCVDGIVVECVTTYEDGRHVTIRNRSCGGGGYVGSDGVVETKDGKTIKSTDENVHDVE